LKYPDRFIPVFAKAGASLISVQVEPVRILHRDDSPDPGMRLPARRRTEPGHPGVDSGMGFGRSGFCPYHERESGLRGPEIYSKCPSENNGICEDGFKAKNLSTLIEIDGGVNETTILEISEAGVDAFVAGSAVFESPDYRKTISTLQTDNQPASCRYMR